MEDLRETILYIAFNLDNQLQAITFATLQQTLEMMLVSSDGLESGLLHLVDNKLLVKKDTQEFLLTRAGKEEAQRISKVRTKEDFSRFLIRCAESRAYLAFCEEVYGYPLHLFNMMDKEQLDFLFNMIPVTKQDTVLDLGCGTGSILNRLVKKYGCRGIGTDQLPKAAVCRLSPLISYHEGDMDELDGYHLTPTIVIAVDSLYFSNDLLSLLDFFQKSHCNRFYFFYSQYIFDESNKDRSILHPDGTRLARTLQSVGMHYQSVDYSLNEWELYKDMLKALPRFKASFAEEGNVDIFEAKIKESRSGKVLYDKGLAARFLYKIGD